MKPPTRLISDVNCVGVSLCIRTLSRAFASGFGSPKNDELLDRAILAIRERAQTGRIGDGKIFVSHIEEAIRIRTGETGADAIL
jgi:hypothetical protein